MANILSFMKRIKVSILLLSIVLVWGVSCNRSSEKKTSDYTVNIHLQAGPDAINPYLYQGASANEILKNVYQSLLAYHPQTLEIMPILAANRPEIQCNDTVCRVTYQLRPEAKWDNGSAVTARDVAFSLKAIKNPLTNAVRVRGYMEFISDIELDANNPLKFTLVCSNLNANTEITTGDFEILPEYFFDSAGYMKDITVKELMSNPEAMSKNENVIKFADKFNSEEIKSSAAKVSGSGPYTVADWKAEQVVFLTKKADWWGDKLAKDNVYFSAAAPKLNYKVINDQATALLALKNGEIDLMKSVNATDFTTISNDTAYKKIYNFYTPSTFAYAYLGMNNTNPILVDKNVRLALAHLTDVNRIAQTIQMGYAQVVTGPVNPALKKDYNSDIKCYEYNAEIAKDLLANAGWDDTDNNGILDKKIGKKKVELKLKFSYNAENKQREATALQLKDAAMRVGISIEPDPQDWGMFLQNMNARNFELFYGAVGTGPIANDHSQLFSTDAIKNGSNYCSYSSATADSMITALIKEADPAKQAALNKQFQQLLHDDVPVVFLFSPAERIVVAKKFTNLNISSLRPGYWPAGFTLQ